MASILRSSGVSTIMCVCVLVCAYLCLSVFLSVYAFIFRFGLSSRALAAVVNTRLNAILYRCSIIKSFLKTLSSGFQPYKSNALASIITHPRSRRSLFTTTVSGLLLQLFADIPHTHDIIICILPSVYYIITLICIQPNTG